MCNHNARKIGFVGIAFPICVALLLISSRAVGGEIPREFLEQYQPFAERGMALYSQVTLEGTIVRNEGNEVLWRNFVCRHDGDKFRLDLTSLPTPHSQGFNGETESEVYIARPNGSLRAERASAITKYVIETYSPADYPELLSEIYNRTSVVTPYRSLGLPILELLRSPRVTVKSITPISKDGREFVEIQAQGQSTESSKVIYDTTILLSPAEGWAVREYTDSDEAWFAKQKDKDPDDYGTKIRWTLDYDGMKNGIPILNRVEYQEWRGRPHPSDVRLLNVESIKFGPSTESDFTADSLTTSK